MWQIDIVKSRILWYEHIQHIILMEIKIFKFHWIIRQKQHIITLLMLVVFNSDIS